MAVAFVSQVTAAVGTAVANVSANEPAGTTGELLVAFCWANSTTAAWTPPGTWSNGDQDTGGSMAVFYKTSADAGGTSQTFTRSSSTAAAGLIIVRLSGWSAFAASDTVNGGAAANLVLPSITAAAANTFLLQFAAKATTTAGSWTAPGTVAGGFAGNTSGSALPYSVGWEEVAAGATGTRTWVASQTQQGRGAIVAISPVAPPASNSGAAFLGLL